MILNPIAAETKPVIPHKYSYDPENKMKGGIKASNKAPPYKVPIFSGIWGSYWLCRWPGSADRKALPVDRKKNAL